MKLPVIGVLCASLCLPVLAAEGNWNEGFGQGNLEYFIDQQGMRLYLGCPTQDGDASAPSSVSLSQVKNGTQAKKFTIRAGGNTYEGPFDAGSRVGENNFLSLIENLKQSDAVVKVGNRSITFPKSNAASVLPGGKKKMQCNLG